MKSMSLGAAIGLLLLAAASPARATLVLNAAGIADGFSASDFATALPDTGGSFFPQGPFGLTVVGNGSGGSNVLVEDYANATLYVFNNSDGQTPATALLTRPFQAYAEGFATLNGVAYGGNGAQYGSLSSTGVFTALNIAGLPAPYYGMAANAATGELITSSSAGLIAINPTTNSFRTIVASIRPDGISMSLDGKTIYAEVNGNIIGYNVATGAVVFTAPKPAGAYAPDGAAVISSSNSLNGDIIVSDNYGNVYLIDPTEGTITLIGTDGNGAGSERGDFVAADFTNGTLLMDFSDEVERLSCGSGCSIGSSVPTSSVPEPGSLILLATGLFGSLTWSRRRRIARV